MPDPRKDSDILDLDDDVSSEELQTQVQRAQAELTELKRRSEQIERDKLRLEELSRRQDEFEDGRGEMMEKLNSSRIVIRRETEEAQKRLEHLEAIYEAFTDHLRMLESINSKTWVGSDLSKELSRAMTALEAARSDYGKAQAKLSVEGIDELPAPHSDYDEYDHGEKGFAYWLTAGFAFTLPLMALLALIALIFGFVLPTAP